jgi:Zc3h12a-like ribonuclease protein
MVSQISSLSAGFASTQSTTLRTPPCAIVDGLNIIRARGKERPQLSILLDVTLRLLRSGFDVLCISDANTRHELRRHEGFQVALAYESLVSGFRESFTECPARMQADPLILAEAEARNAVVVSNDLFRDPIFRRRFNWLDETSRFARVAVVRNHYHFLDARCPIRTDTHALIAELERRLGALRPKV